VIDRFVAAVNAPRMAAAGTRGGMDARYMLGVGPAAPRRASTRGRRDGARDHARHGT